MYSIFFTTESYYINQIRGSLGKQKGSGVLAK